jgi:type I restriction enzyme S subunit
MAGEWECCTWGDAVSLEYGKALRGHATSSGRYRVFGSNGPIGWTHQPLADGPGVILGRKGAYRGVQFSPQPFHVIDTAYFVVPRMPMDMRWLYYAVKHYRLGEIDDGSPIPSTTRAAVYVQELEVPPLPEQKRIAHVLGTLDDKIELNRKMNATLEGISRAIFKSWFVDFDPVRQKAAGRQAVGVDAQTAALFPDSFEDAEIGEVPKGWRVGRLDDAVVLQRGFDLPASARTDGKHPVMAAGGLNGFHKEYMVRGPGVTTGRSGVLGRVYFVHEDFWPLNTSLWVKEYRASSPLHAYHMLTRIDFSVFNAGSAVPTLNRNHVHGLPVILAGSDVVHAFDAVIGPMFKANRLRETESHTLAALRDTLLSKLLSGEIRVPEAEEVAAST